ncbi:lysophospholipid acyltransferase family protein [Rubrivirga sp.]|uniref:lysophospholipid acyltransferase family protein n=1 Tax=Rubrivirga sp. TaxID=1885344 RepID=UPI003B51C640
MPVRLAVSRLHYAWTLAWCAVVSAVLIGPGLVYYRLRPTSRRFWQWMRVWSRSVLGGAGLRVVSTGRAPAGPAVFVANHQAMLDIPALFLGIGQPFVFVARSELRRIPLVGTVLTATRCVYLDRADAGPALAEAARRVAEGDAIVFFPEGTRSYGRGVGRFRTGAFRLAIQAGVPVVPIAIDGSPGVLNERARTARPGAVTVRVGAPLRPLPGEDARAFAARARADVLRLLSA